MLFNGYKIVRTFKVKSEMDYDTIMHLVATNNAHRIIQGIVSTCRANKDVMFVMYRHGSDSILVICGSQPSTFLLPGNNLEAILTSAEFGYIYCWCYQKK